MKKVIILLAAALLFAACNSNSTGEKDIKELTLEELNAQAVDMNDAKISVEGMVTHVCKHGGQKMFITDQEKNIDILVRVSNSIPEFDVALEGSKVKITGKVIVSLAEETSDMNGEGMMEHAEGGESTEENCPTEEAMKDSKEAGAGNVTYYIEAAEYAELK